MWEDINTETFLRHYCKEDYNNVTADEFLNFEPEGNAEEQFEPPTVKTWKEQAAKMQQNMADMLGDRLFDSIPFREKTLLHRKLGFALYGPPQNENSGIGYEEEQMKCIDAVATAIIQLQGARKDEIYCHTIFVMLFIEGEHLIPVPVFRVPKPDCPVDESCSMMFVDSLARVYNSWKDFLQANKLPKCCICYPVDGIYTFPNDKVQLEYGKSAACSAQNEALETLDQVSTVATVGATAVVLASLAIPVAGPIMAAASIAGGVTGIYGFGRGVSGLVDRGSHGQSVGLTDPEARGHWVTTVGSALNFASAKAMSGVATAARSGQVATKTVLTTANCLQYGSLVVNGFGIANHGYSLYLKKQSGEDLTPLDYFQLASSVLFFSNSVMNIKTAETVFQQEQNNYLKQHRDGLRSNNHRRQFDKLERNTRKGLDATEGKAKVIRGINSIENQDDFYAGVKRVNKQYKFYKADIKFNENGQIHINGKVALHPMELWKMPKSDRGALLNATKDFCKGKMTDTQFNKEVRSIFRRNNVTFTDSSIQDVRNMCTAFGCKDLFKTIFQDETKRYSCSPAVLEIFYSLITHADYKLVFATAAEIAHRMNWSTAESFLKFMQFACPYFSTLYNEFQDAYYTYCSAMQEEIPLSTAFHCIMLNVYNSYRTLENLKMQYERFRNSTSENPMENVRGIPLNATFPQTTMNTSKFIIFAELFYSMYSEVKHAIYNLQNIRHLAGLDDEQLAISLSMLLQNLLETYRIGKRFVEMYQQNSGANAGQCSPIMQCTIFCRIAAVIAVDLGYINIGEFLKFIAFMLQRLFAEYGKSTEDPEMLEAQVRSCYQDSQQYAELQDDFYRYICEEDC